MLPRKLVKKTEHLTSSANLIPLQHKYMREECMNSISLLISTIDYNTSLFHSEGVIAINPG